MKVVSKRRYSTPHTIPIDAAKGSFPIHYSLVGFVTIYYYSQGLTDVLTNYIRHIKHTKRTKSKIGQERSSMQKADYQFHRHIP